MDKQMRLEVRVGLYGNDGSRLSIDESVDMGSMDFGQISKLLEAFHIIAEAVKQGLNVNLNGQEYRYFGTPS